MATVSQEIDGEEIILTLMTTQLTFRRVEALVEQDPNARVELTVKELAAVMATNKATPRVRKRRKRDASVTHGDFIAYGDGHTVTYRHKPLIMGDRAVRLLTELIRQRGQVASERNLRLNALHELNNKAQIQQLISHIRRALRRAGCGCDPKTLVVNVHMQGYYLAPEHKPHRRKAW